MFATLCSNPQAMNASRHHQMTMHFAESELTRAAIHSARHTSQLHRIARANRLKPESFILNAATFMTRVSGAESSPPPPPAANSATSATEPTKFPAHVIPHELQRDAERRPHHQFLEFLGDLAAEGEDEKNADADIGAGEHAGNEKSARMLAHRGEFFFCGFRKSLDRFGVHGLCSPWVFKERTASVMPTASFLVM